MGLVTVVLLSVGHVTDLHPSDFIRHLTIKEQMGPETQDGLCHFSSSVSVRPSTSFYCLCQLRKFNLSLTLLIWVY